MQKQEQEQEQKRSEKYEYVNLMLESQGYSLDKFLEYAGTLKRNPSPAFIAGGSQLDAWSLSEFPTVPCFASRKPNSWCRSSDRWRSRRRQPASFGPR